MITLEALLVGIAGTLLGVALMFLVINGALRGGFRPPRSRG